MMDNAYPNEEFIRRVANFREDLEAFMQTTDDEGNPNQDYTFDDQKKLYETMMNRAYDLALFIETQETNGYRLVKAEADPVSDVVPGVSPAPAVDDEWLQNVLGDVEAIEVPAWLIGGGDDDPLEDIHRAFMALRLIEERDFYKDGILTLEGAHKLLDLKPYERPFTLTDQARAMLALHEPVSVTDYPVAFDAVEVLSMGDDPEESDDDDIFIGDAPPVEAPTEDEIMEYERFERSSVGGNDGR